MNIHADRDHTVGMKGSITAVNNRVSHHRCEKG